MRPRPGVAAGVQREALREGRPGHVVVTAEERGGTDIGHREGREPVLAEPPAVSSGRPQQSVGALVAAAEKLDQAEILRGERRCSWFVESGGDGMRLLEQRYRGRWVGLDGGEVAGYCQALRAGCGWFGALRHQPGQPTPSFTELTAGLPVEPQVSGEAKAGHLLAGCVRAELECGAQLAVLLGKAVQVRHLRGADPIHLCRQSGVVVTVPACCGGSATRVFEQLATEQSDGL